MTAGTDEVIAEIASRHVVEWPDGQPVLHMVENAIREALSRVGGREAERLDWMARNLFDRKWRGTIGRPCDWYVRGDYRHTTQRMKGQTLREAIDTAMAKEG